MWVVLKQPLRRLHRLLVEKPSLRLASCVSVDVVNGAGGRRRLASRR
jgi:hypothetical protein